MKQADEMAFEAGKSFAEAHPFSEFSDDPDSKRLMDHCPAHLQRFADVFKYGCQSVWRVAGLGGAW